MKNRITTPTGKRVIPEDIGSYFPYEEKVQDNFVIVVARRGVEGEFQIHFETIEKRDAFLARLDSYFQEIP